MTCWFCERGETDGEADEVLLYRGAARCSLHIPRCRMCRHVHASETIVKTMSSIGGGLAGLVGFLLMWSSGVTVLAVGLGCGAMLLGGLLAAALAVPVTAWMRGTRRPSREAVLHPVVMQQFVYGWRARD